MLPSPKPPSEYTRLPAKFHLNDFGDKPNDQAAVHDLGYSQNLAARNLALGRSTLPGLMISDIRNPFFPDVTAAFQDQALLHNMESLVLNTNYDAQRTMNAVKRLIGLQVPAVAILTSQIDAGLMDTLAGYGVAAVYLNLGRIDRLISNILPDYEHGIAEALEHLTKLGHWHIAYIGGPSHYIRRSGRKKAFLESKWGSIPGRRQKVWRSARYRFRRCGR